MSDTETSTKKAKATKAEKPTPQSEPKLSAAEVQLAAALKQIEELRAMLSVTKADPMDAKTPSPEPAMESMKAALTAARKREQAGKRLAEEAANEEVYPVENVCGAYVVVEVSDAKGQFKRVAFENRGAVQYLTAGQIMEVKDRTRFFEDGMLAAGQVIEESANVIRDYDVFIRTTPLDRISKRLAEVTSVATLRGLYEHIENMRFDVVNDELVKVEIDPKATLILHAVLDRLYATTGVRISTTDAD